MPRKLLLVRPTGKRRGREPYPPQEVNNPLQIWFALRCGADLEVVDFWSTVGNLPLTGR